MALLHCLSRPAENPPDSSRRAPASSRARSRAIVGQEADREGAGIQTVSSSWRGDQSAGAVAIWRSSPSGLTHGRDLLRHRRRRLQRCRNAVGVREVADPVVGGRPNLRTVPAGGSGHSSTRRVADWRRLDPPPGRRSLVAKVGFEPTRGCPQRCLRPPRLPFRHFAWPGHRSGAGTTAAGPASFRRCPAQPHPDARLAAPHHRRQEGRARRAGRPAVGGRRGSDPAP